MHDGNPLEKSQFVNKKDYPFKQTEVVSLSIKTNHTNKG
jgi:hypothetical protein